LRVQCVTHGGIDDWKAAGKPVTKEATTLPPVVVQLAAHDGLVLWNQDMLEHVRAGGDDIRAVRGGHVPGAVNIPHEQNWQDPQTAAKLTRKEVHTRDSLALKDEVALRALYATLDPGTETIVYCQSGARASLTSGPTQWSVRGHDPRTYHHRDG